MCACKTAGTGWGSRRRRRRCRRDESGENVWRTTFLFPFAENRNFILPKIFSAQRRVPFVAFPDADFDLTFLFFNQLAFQAIKTRNYGHVLFLSRLHAHPFLTLYVHCYSQREVQASFKFTEGQARPSPPFKNKDSLSTA